MRNFGRFLKKRSFHNFQPYFEIWEDSLQLDKIKVNTKLDIVSQSHLLTIHKKKKITITTNHIRGMEDRATFDVGKIELSLLARTSVVNITLCLVDPKDPRDGPFPISGFPRALILDELPISMCLVSTCYGK